MSPTPKEIVTRFIRGGVMDGLSRHNGNGMIEPASVQDRREREWEPEPWEPSREAVELSKEIIEYLIQWEDLSNAFETFDERQRGSFTLGLQKIFDDWNNENHG